MSRSRIVGVSSAVLLGGGILMMVLRQVNGETTGLIPDVSSIAFGAPILGAATLAWLGNRYSEPIYVAFAGIAAIIMSVVSILMFPLVIPAGILVWASVPVLKDVDHKEAAVAVGASVLLVLSFMIPIVISGTASEPHAEAALTRSEAEYGPLIAITVVVVVLILIQRHLRSQR